jgi:hypothetical protein
MARLVAGASEVPCIPAVPVTCVPVGDAVGSAAGGVLGNAFAEAMRDGATWIMRTTIGVWIDVPAIDLAASPASTIRGYVLWLAAAVAAGGAMWQGVVVAVSRRPEPLLSALRGLFYLALWSAIGIVGPATALQAGDAFSSWVLDRAAGGQASERLLRLAGLSTVSSSGAVIVFGLAMMLLGLTQAVLMMLREGSVIVLSGAVVLAAAGSLTQATRPWLPRVLGWMAALICYKPAAALVYASALAMVGDGDDPRTVVLGLAMMLLAVVALPALMRLFTWTTGSASSGGGGAAAVAGTTAAAVHAYAALRGDGALRQSENIRTDLGTPSSGSPAPGWSLPGPTAGAGAATGGSPRAATGGTSGAAAAGPAAAVVLGAQAATSAANRAAREAGDAMSDSAEGDPERGTR